MECVGSCLNALDVRLNAAARAERQRRAAELKTRKSLTGALAAKKVDDDDSEDDFVPNKAALKAAPKRAECRVVLSQVLEAEGEGVTIAVRVLYDDDVSAVAA